LSLENFYRFNCQVKFLSVQTAVLCEFSTGNLAGLCGFLFFEKGVIMFVRFFSGQKNTWFSKAVETAFVLVVAVLVFTGCPQPTGSGGGLPAKPVITSVVPNSTTSLTVTWGAASGAVYYEVYYASAGSPMPENTNVSNLTTKSATLSSLTADGGYTVWVKAVNEAGSVVSDPWGTKVYNPAPLEDLEGTWVSAWGEEYIIDGGEFISAYGGATSYKGPIVNIRIDSSNSTKGYITIRYTENTYTPEAAGNYYVIRWEDWAADTSISITGAYNTIVEGNGYATLSEAENGYTGSIGESGGSFAGFSECYFTDIESQPSAIAGSWKENTYDDSYTITDRLVIYAPSGYTTFVGEIVNIRNLAADTNYITFKYITNDTAYVGAGLVGKYCVLYWTNFTANASVKIATAYSSTSPGDEGKSTQEEAEAEYTIDNSADYFSDLYQFTPPSN
jgi:hypothetical protein